MSDSDSWDVETREELFSLTGNGENRQLDRYAAAIGGGALVAYGIARRSLGGMLVAAAGASIVASELLQNGRSERNPGELLFWGERMEEESIRSSITILRDPSELFHRWRNVEDWTLLLSRLQAVEKVSDGRYKWMMEDPWGTKEELETSVRWYENDRRVTWRSVKGSSFTHLGSVSFRAAPGDRGSEMRVKLYFETTKPRFASRLVTARQFVKDSQAVLDDDLRRFKQRVECGEIATTRGQSSGRSARERPTRPGAITRTVRRITITAQGEANP